MHNKTIGMFAALGVIALLGIGFVAAYPGFGQDISEEELEERRAFRDDVRAAIAAEDYDTWKALMESRLTEETFNTLVEKHDAFEEKRVLLQELRDAVENGDTATAEDIRAQLQELGFDGHHRRGFHGMKAGF